MDHPDSQAEQGGPDSSEPVLLLARDLLMSSRVTTLAKQSGVPVRLVRDPAQMALEMPARLLIVDLDLEGAIAAAQDWAARTNRQAAGFVQHVHVETIRLATAAGIKPVIPRSRLAIVLPELLGRSAG